MAEGVDFSPLTRGERTVLVGGGLLFVNALVPWWFRARDAGGRLHSYNAGLRGWTTAAALLGFAAAIAVVVRAWRYPQRGPADGLAYVGIGAAALAVLAIEISRGRAVWIGVWVGAAAAALIVYGGIRRRSERRAGWI